MPNPHVYGGTGVKTIVYNTKKDSKEGTQEKKTKKRKELHTHRCKKYPRTCPSTGTKSNEFFFFIVVFLQPFTLFFFLFLPPSFSIPLSFLSFFVLYTMIFTSFPPSTCGSGVGSPFSLFPLPLLEPSILSCKTACSLFRHHLHINVARELAGQYLMRG